MDGRSRLLRFGARGEDLIGRNFIVDRFFADRPMVEIAACGETRIERQS